MPEGPGAASAGADKRLDDPLKFMPVVFVWLNIIGLWFIYMTLHCLPMLAQAQDHDWAVAEIVVFNVVVLLQIICYVRCIMTHPGTIPGKESGNSTWEYVHSQRPGSGDTKALGLDLKEMKKSGDRRHCKWCAKYKPDRCHHCRVCRQCILKMDHHCPWIYNCVGFGNHKYFFLVLLYSCIALHMIVWTMMSNFNVTGAATAPFVNVFFLILGETVAAFLGVIVTGFFAFHIFLMLKGMTTIEFCEKSMTGAGYNTSIYNRGCCGNIQAVLGDNPLLWLLPCNPPSGDGLVWVKEDSPFGRGMEAGRGVRQKSVGGRGTRQKPVKNIDGPAMGQQKRQPRKAAGTGEYAFSDTGQESGLSDPVLKVPTDENILFSVP